jgi:dTDP-4-dehydrorhamnose reductase
MGSDVMSVAVIGATGRLGSILTTELLGRGYRVSTLNYPEFDITNGIQVNSVLRSLKPHTIVNCSAYNAVDAAETNIGAAFAINAHGPSFLAEAAEALDVTLVHFSTDFVFDGETDRPYTELDRVNPLSVYGASKKAGEDAVRGVARHYILRLESLFGGTGLDGHRATVDFLLDSILSRSVVRVVADRTLTPSYVPDVVAATLALIARRSDDGFGTYHCVNSGPTTWYELTREIARQLNIAVRIETLAASDLKTVARRPRQCALSNDKIQALGIDMPTWQSAIDRHVRQRSATPTLEAASPAS